MELLTQWRCKTPLWKTLSGPSLCNLVVAHRKCLRARFFLTVLKAIISFPYLSRWPCVSLSRKLAKGKGQINKKQNLKKTGQKKFLRFFLGLTTKSSSRWTDLRRAADSWQPAPSGNRCGSWRKGKPPRLRVSPAPGEASPTSSPAQGCFYTPLSARGGLIKS